MFDHIHIVMVDGVGGISGAHIPAWEEIKEVELVALCDIRQERLDQYPKKRHYNDFKEMLEKEDLDILDICLPTYLHADYAIMAMEKGINVICEKPISLKEEGSNGFGYDPIFISEERYNEIKLEHSNIALIMQMITALQRDVDEIKLKIA